MTGAITITNVLAALILPWLLGTLLLKRLLNSSNACNWAIAVGHGFFAGIFSVTLLLRAFDSLNMPISFTSVSISIVLCGAAILFYVNRAPVITPTVAPNAKLDRLPLIVLSLLLALVTVRYSTLLIELTSRPMYAWDAWMNWAPKAVVWFRLGEMAPYVAPPEWLQTTDDVVYTLGNYQASTYPDTVPLLYWWMMLATGSSESSLVLLPWLLAPLALGFALYGHLRSNGVSPLMAGIAFYALVNMPYVNVHTALAGYADIWMAAAFSLSLFALSARESTGELRWTLLCVFWCIFAATIKRPGVFFAAFVLFGLARSILRPPHWLELGAIGLVIAFLALAFTVGVTFDIPQVGQFKLDSTGIKVPSFGHQAFIVTDITNRLLTTLLGMLNWNLLFYLTPLILIAFLGWGLQETYQQKNVVLVLALATTFLALIYTFTDYSAQLMNLVTFNRTMLYLIPGFIYLLFARLVREWSDNQTLPDKAHP
ncbi:hypothetical protein OAN12_00670 [Halioglobus sp.]|nr:hypothetical protein [Halioglobus sp.]